MPSEEGLYFVSSEPQLVAEASTLKADGESMNVSFYDFKTEPAAEVMSLKICTATPCRGFNSVGPIVAEFYVTFRSAGISRQDGYLCIKYSLYRGCDLGPVH